MTKEICVVVTPSKATQLGIRCRSDRGVLAPFNFNLQQLSPAARWIAEHITATYVMDEYRDICQIIAVAGISMAERDRTEGKSDADIAWGYYVGGKEYGEPMTVKVVFSSYGMTMDCPEKVLEEAVARYIGMGSIRLMDAHTKDTFELEGGVRPREIKKNRNPAKNKERGEVR